MVKDGHLSSKHLIKSIFSALPWHVASLGKMSWQRRE